MDDNKKREKKKPSTSEERKNRIQQLVSKRSEDASQVVKSWISQETTKKLKK